MDDEPINLHIHKYEDDTEKDNIREVSIGTPLYNIHLVSSYEDETIDLLLEKAVTTLQKLKRGDK